MNERTVKPTIVESPQNPVAVRPRTRKERPVDSQSVQKAVATQQESTRKYRPTARPPMALICLLDDDGNDGEWFRVRASETTIGRAGADIVVPHDEQISGVHVQLSRRFQENRFQWYLKDLNSMNGTFLKVSKARMQNELEVLIGGHRYRFEFSTPDVETSPDQPSPGTRGWRVVAPPDPKSLMPSFVRLLPDGDGIRLALSQSEHKLGSDPQQATPVIADDPMVSPIHAKIWCDPTGKWFLQDESSLNGIWVRISDKRLDTDTAVQIGEQRLIVKIS